MAMGANCSRVDIRIGKPVLCSQTLVCLNLRENLRCYSKATPFHYVNSLKKFPITALSLGVKLNC